MLLLAIAMLGSFCAGAHAVMACDYAITGNRWWMWVNLFWMTYAFAWIAVSACLLA